MVRKRHRWTAEQIDFLREGCKTHTRVEMVSELKKRFNIDVSVTQVNTATRVHNIECLRTPQARYLPIGSESKIDGYTYIKIDNTGVYKKDWILKHHLLWKENGGEIPRGHQLLFLDGNKDNLAIENLVLMKVGEILHLNISGLMSDDIEINKAAVQLAKLKNRISEVSKQKK